MFKVEDKKGDKVQEEQHANSNGEWLFGKQNDEETKLDEKIKDEHQTCSVSTSVIITEQNVNGNSTDDKNIEDVKEEQKVDKNNPGHSENDQIIDEMKGDGKENKDLKETEFDLKESKVGGASDEIKNGKVEDTTETEKSIQKEKPRNERRRSIFSFLGKKEDSNEERDVKSVKDDLQGHEEETEQEDRTPSKQDSKEILNDNKQDQPVKPEPLPNNQDASSKVKPDKQVKPDKAGTVIERTEELEDEKSSPTRPPQNTPVSAVIPNDNEDADGMPAQDDQKDDNEEEREEDQEGLEEEEIQDMDDTDEKQEKDDEDSNTTNDKTKGDQTNQSRKPKRKKKRIVSVKLNWNAEAKVNTNKRKTSKKVKQPESNNINNNETKSEASSKNKGKKNGSWK